MPLRGVERGALAEHAEHDQAVGGDAEVVLDLAAQRGGVHLEPGPRNGVARTPQSPGQSGDGFIGPAFRLAGEASRCRPLRCSASVTTCSAIASADVAPGEGALRTCTHPAGAGDHEVVDQLAAGVHRLRPDPARSGANPARVDLGDVGAGAGDERGARLVAVRDLAHGGRDVAGGETPEAGEAERVAQVARRDRGRRRT